MANMENFISVIIPCYNNEPFVAEALDSVLNQTYIKAVKEIIVVDDGSKDGSATVIKKKAAFFPIIKYIYQVNGGLSAARNTGLKIAKGEYIAFLDADDVWLLDKIEKQCQALEQYPKAGLFYTDIFKYYYKQEKLIPLKVNAYQVDEQDMLFKYVAKGGPVIPSTVLVKKVCFDDAGLFDTNLYMGGEDTDMWLRIARSYPFQHVKGYLLKKRALQDSLGANTYENAKGYKIALDKLQQLEPAIAPYRRKRDALIHYKVGLYFYKKGENTKAFKEVSKSFIKDFRLFKAYALWLAIVVKQLSGIKLLRTN